MEMFKTSHIFFSKQTQELILGCCRTGAICTWENKMVVNT